MKKIILLLIAIVLIIPQLTSADYYFNPHFIISDEDFTDYMSMSPEEIQDFLESKNSGLANLITPDYLGIRRRASEIIWQAAYEEKISPKVLLATLQKEQSLIQTPNPTTWQLDRAMGYRCPDDGKCNESTLHFGKQVDGAAWQFRQYMNSPNDWHYKAGEEYIIDGFIIQPMNHATAGLYNYTPHHHGNKRFWQIYQDYFGLNYPDGSLVKTKNDPGVWLIKYGERRLITSWGVLLSRFDPNKILLISQTDLEKYEIGSPIQFYNYSILESDDGKVYLLVNDELRYIPSPEVFRILGFNWEEIIEVNSADLAGYSYGDEITVYSIYPTGALLQNKETGGVYFVENGIKKPIYSKEIMDANYKGKVLTQVSPQELERYETGEPVKFKDGELIKAKGQPEVYVVADGYRRWIKNEKSFANFTYKWDNIIETSQAAVNIHPLGEAIE